MGMGTVEGNHLTRLFVLAKYQGQGIGTALLNYLEDMIIREYGSVLLDASLPSGEFYRKRRYVQVEHREHHVENGKILSYEVMRKRYLPIDPEIYNAPAQLVRKEMELQGIDFDELKNKISSWIYLLADSLYDTILEKNVGTLKYHVGGEVYVMNHNDHLSYCT
ncbi:MAG: GNAT family N-acetyltransferase [Lachnospiraceae bacterium]|nr:GNAT family N-acetyltransferase [Lachnospiraceae bacterium]